MELILRCDVVQSEYRESEVEIRFGGMRGFAVLTENREVRADAEVVSGVEVAERTDEVGVHYSLQMDARLKRVPLEGWKKLRRLV